MSRLATEPGQRILPVAIEVALIGLIACDEIGHGGRLHQLVPKAIQHGALQFMLRDPRNALTDESPFLAGIGAVVALGIGARDVHGAAAGPAAN
nr:hypothetical protein [Asaia siamensis]